MTIYQGYEIKVREQQAVGMHNNHEHRPLHLLPLMATAGEYHRRVIKPVTAHILSLL